VTADEAMDELAPEAAQQVRQDPGPPLLLLATNHGSAHHCHGRTSFLGAAVHTVARRIEPMGSALVASEPSNDGGIVTAVHHAASMALNNGRVKFRSTAPQAFARGRAVRIQVQRPPPARQHARRSRPRLPRHRSVDGTPLVVPTRTQRADSSQHLCQRGVLVPRGSSAESRQRRRCPRAKMPQSFRRWLHRSGWRCNSSCLESLRVLCHLTRIPCLGS
jgi:hypothetical protein